MTQQPPIQAPAKLIHGNQYLLHGQLETWQGPSSEVRSPLLDSEGNRTLLGAVPDLGSEVGMAALESAKKAYDHGRGAWPTTPAGERIAAMETFIERILPRRDEVVDLLMWETLDFRR